jgi:hypothetical protein
MKPQKRIERERLFGPTPQVVTRRLHYALNHLEEEKQMKKRTVPVLAIILVLALAGVAYAAVSGGLKWYYENRFDYGGNLPQDVVERIQSGLRQGGEGNPLAHVTIDGAAWLGKGLGGSDPTAEVLDIHVRASAKDPARYEMAGANAIDTDAARGEEERREHPEYGDRADEAWLWAYGTHGPLDKVMKDPTKQLLLFGNQASFDDFWIVGAEDMPLPMFSSDEFVDGETGEVGVNYSFAFSDAEFKALREHADEDGTVTLVYRSWAWPFVDGAAEPEWTAGTTMFSIRLPE